MRSKAIPSKQKHITIRKDANLSKQGFFIFNAVKGVYKGNAMVVDFNPIKIDSRQARSLTEFKTINNPNNLKRAKSTQQAINVEAKNDHRQKTVKKTNQKYLDTVPVVFYSQKPYVELFISQALYHRSMISDDFQKKMTTFQQKLEQAKNNNEKSQLFEPKASDNYCFICKQEISQLYTQFQHVKTKQHKNNLDKSIGQKYIMELVSDQYNLNKLLSMNHDHNLVDYKLKGSINAIKIDDQQQKQDEVEVTNVRRRKKVTLGAYNQDIVCLSDSVEQIDEPQVQEQPRKFIKTFHFQQMNPKASQMRIDQRMRYTNNNIPNTNLPPRRFYGNRQATANSLLNNTYLNKSNSQNQTNLDCYNFSHNGARKDRQVYLQRQRFQPQPQRTIKIIQKPSNNQRLSSSNKSTVNFLKQEIRRKAKSHNKYEIQSEFRH